MNKTEIKSKVNELLSSGTSKSEVFGQLSGLGVKDSQLAYFIASYPNPERCKQHRGKVKFLVLLMFIQTVLAFLMILGMDAKVGVIIKWIVGAFFSIIPMSFAWGFYTNRVAAYNVYIMLSLIQLPKSFEGFSSSSVSSWIGIALEIGLIACVWYVREKVFPGFAFMRPKRLKGEYVFVN
jgi:hypothetical protein